MLPIILVAHSWLRWLIMLAALVAIVKAVVSMAQNQPYDALSRNAMMATAMLLSLQWVLGIVAFIVYTVSYGFEGRLIGHFVIMTGAVGLAHYVRRQWADEPPATHYRNDLLALLGVALLIVVGVFSLGGGMARWTL